MRITHPLATSYTGPYYVERKDGVIVGIFALEQDSAHERLEQSHPDLAAYLSRAKRPTKIISDRQFFHALALEGKITEQEAEDAVATGAIPAAMQAIVDGISDHNAKFAAKMLLKGATEFDNKHPLVTTYAAAQSPPMTDADVDALWDFASTL